MANNSIASNEPNLNAFYTTPQYCLEIIHAHAEFVKWEDKPGGPVVAGCMAKRASAWAEVLLPEAKRLNVGMQAFPLWLQGVVEASGLDGGMGERAWQHFRTVEQLWPKVDAELVRLREAAISEAVGEVEPAQTATPPANDAPRIVGFLDAELIQRTYGLTPKEWERVRQKLKYWKRTNEDKVKPITDDPDKPPRYLYPAAIVEEFVAAVRAK